MQSSFLWQAHSKPLDLGRIQIPKPCLPLRSCQECWVVFLLHIYFILLFLAASSLKLWHAGPFIVRCRLFSSCSAYGLSGCGVRASLPHSMWGLSSPTRGWTCVPCIGRQILNHWTTREVLHIYFRISSSQPYLKTTELYEKLLLLSSLSHYFYFIFSAPISFSLCFPISPSVLF